VGAGIAALNGPLHGGANEKAIYTLKEIENVGNVKPWVEEQRRLKKKIAGFGHRVYKAYDPRARILAPIARELVKENKEAADLFEVAQELEREVISRFGKEKNIFPNVDFYSGIVYRCLGISSSMFVSLFAVSRVAGWTARVLEYLEKNRIFRPRAIYTGVFNKKVAPISER
jgi:citrate synthase